MTATATKFVRLLSRKNATDRRAMCPGSMPPRRRTQAPKTSPAAPLAGAIEPMPSWAREMSRGSARPAAVGSAATPPNVPSAGLLARRQLEQPEEALCRRAAALDLQVARPPAAPQDL